MRYGRGVPLASPALRCSAQRPRKPSSSQHGPNILVIFGDDIGQTNISAYTHGLVGYQTPNIDRIAKEGMMFTDYYAENSCTAGRSILHHRADAQAHRPFQGRHPGRAGRAAGPATSPSPRRSSRWATPPASSARTIWATATSICRRIHGFDEFFGNLYHLNAEEEPERPYWPKDDTAYVKANSPRGVLKCRQATGTSRQHALGPVGKQHRRHRAAQPQADGDDRRRDHCRRDRFHAAAGRGPTGHSSAG